MTNTEGYDFSLEVAGQANIHGGGKEYMTWFFGELENQCHKHRGVVDMLLNLTEWPDDAPQRLAHSWAYLRRVSYWSHPLLGGDRWSGREDYRKQLATSLTSPSGTLEEFLSQRNESVDRVLRIFGLSAR